MYIYVLGCQTVKILNMMVFQNGVPEKIVGTKGLIKSVSSDISQMLICFS